MSDTHQRPLFCSVNQSLGAQPSLGPIPTSLLFPSLVIVVGSYCLTQLLFQLGFAAFVLFTAWMTCTWWVVVGDKTWQFTNKLVPVPSWSRGHVRYQPYLT
ncbi:MAG: hypothetical protein AAFY33_16870 [Cyanobacteria bacterium J06643_4]